MNLLVLFFITIISFSSFANNCDDIDKTQFTGVFEKIEYACEEISTRASTCYTNADSYTKVSLVSVELLPLGMEQGLGIKLIDNSRVFDRVILEHTFSKNMINPDSELICSEYIENGAKISIIEEKKIKGSFRSSIKIINTNGALSFEINSSYYEDSSEYKFKLSE